MTLALQIITGGLNKMKKSPQSRTEGERCNTNRYYILNKSLYRLVLYFSKNKYNAMNYCYDRIPDEMHQMKRWIARAIRKNDGRVAKSISVLSHKADDWNTQIHGQRSKKL